MVGSITRHILRGRSNSVRRLANLPSTHPEGWRDWPYETPPTALRGTVAIPSGTKTNAWEMRLRASSPWIVLRRRTRAEGRDNAMPADALQCKECKTAY